jgi:hypothetical protein
MPHTRASIPIRLFSRPPDQAIDLKTVWVESPGLAHEWQTWRLALNDFAPRLFRKQ